MFVRADLLGILLMAGLGLAGCAAVAPPLGGPRDTTPPRRVASSPDSAARNVSQRFVRLTFSEPIQLKDLSKQLLITPQLPADNPYKLRTGATDVTLAFDKPLDANTTYSFNFRDAVVDANESLPAKNARVSFSTGPALDSGRVRGVVTDLLSTAPAAEATIGLYRLADTAGVRRGRPYYLTRTDDKGTYSLDFLRTGDYRLYAWADKNNNGRYDDGERIAYLPAPVAVGAATPAQPLVLTRPDRRPPLRTGQTPAATVVTLAYNEGLTRATLAPLAGAAAPAGPAAVAEAVQLASSGRSLLIYRTPAVPDGRYLLAVADSAGNEARDTISLRFPQPAATAVRKAAPAPLYAVEGAPRSVYRQGQVRFVFAVPVRLAAGRPVGELAEDSVRRRPLRPAEVSLSPDRSQLTVQLDSKALKNVEIRLDSAAVQAVTGQALRLRPLRLTLTEQDPTGILSGAIITKETRFELQLLDDKLKVVSTLTNPKGSYRFARLAPGAYRLRVLVDRNGDGRWQGGNPDLLTPPEPVILYPKTLQVRANWEVEEKLAF